MALVAPRGQSHHSRRHSSFQVAKSDSAKERPIQPPTCHVDLAGLADHSGKHTKNYGKSPF